MVKASGDQKVQVSFFVTMRSYFVCNT